MAAKQIPSLAELPAPSQVAAEIPLPASTCSVFTSGAVVLGWAHAASDFDFYVVAEQVPSPEELAHFGIPGRNYIAPGEFVPALLLNVHGTRWDTEFWTCAQIDAVIRRFGNQAHDLTEMVDLPFTRAEVDIMFRISRGQPLVGEQWLRDAQAAVRGSKVISMVVRQKLDYADGYLEDALGLMEVGNFPSALVAARDAFGFVVDALVAQGGFFSPVTKWRPKQVEAAGLRAPTFAEYWAVETMKGLDPENPAPWVHDVVARCRELMMDIEVA